MFCLDVCFFDMGVDVDFVWLWVCLESFVGKIVGIDIDVVIVCVEVVDIEEWLCCIGVVYFNVVVCVDMVMVIV